MPTLTRLASKAKSARNLSDAIQRNRLNGANGGMHHSNSLDNEDTEFELNRTIGKSKTLNTISNNIKRMSDEETTANGKENVHIERKNNKRRRLFRRNVDNSPLWTTLTHARTITDFTTES